jgi:hypothetical protein
MEHCGELVPTARAGRLRSGEPSARPMGCQGMERESNKSLAAVLARRVCGKEPTIGEIGETGTRTRRLTEGWSVVGGRRRLAVV